MAEVAQYEIGPGDTRNDVLNTLAGGKPWVMVTASNAPGDDLDISVETGGGIRNVTMIRNLLTATLNALPEES